MKLNDILLTDGIFSKADCDALLIELAHGPYETGTVSDNVTDAAVRSSQIQFVPFTKGFGWVFNKLAAIAASGNAQSFGFDIARFEEGFQFARYEAGGHYTWHTDIGDEDERIRRKLALVVQLNDDYEGGELQFFPRRLQIPKRAGLVALFPTYLVHRVAPVTAGVRYSLVAWVAGDRPFV
jgi:PKHD-type hydroxylase